jgi:hypothetical protein
MGASGVEYRRAPRGVGFDSSTLRMTTINKCDMSNGVKYDSTGRPTIVMCRSTEGVKLFKYTGLFGTYICETCAKRLEELGKLHT